MSADSRSSQPTTQSRPELESPDRPLGVSIICLLGVIGSAVVFLPLLLVRFDEDIATPLGIVFSSILIAHFVVLNDLWNVRKAGLKWAYLYYGTGLVLTLASRDFSGSLVLLGVLAYLSSVSENFE